MTGCRRGSLLHSVFKYSTERMGWIWFLAAHHRHFSLCGYHWTSTRVKILLDFLFCCMFSANLNFCFDSWTEDNINIVSFTPAGSGVWSFLRSHVVNGQPCLTFISCLLWPRKETSTPCVWSEDRTVVPNETEEWWHTVTLCWQNQPTLKL